MTKIKEEDRVKWTSQSGGHWREKVGIVVGIVPGDDERHALIALCGPITSHKYQFEFYWGRYGNYIYGRSNPSYLVSVCGKTNKAKRGLYWPRQVELCESDDERDGVYLVEQGEKNEQP